MSIDKCERILIAPLDWGLGHTTRCVPIISYLRQLGHEVIVAGNAWQLNYINETFKHIETIHLEGYEVSYSKSGSGFFFSIVSQMPRLLKIIHKEYKWLLTAAAKYNITRIISDNRYGLSHPSIPSVIMTHQLQIQSGMGIIADNILWWLHYKYLNRFNECWVADVAGSNNLSGKLGHTASIPLHTQYIGLLSQFEKVSDETPEDYILILLSGPEPQRSILSDLLWKQIQHYKGNIIFVEGSNRITERANIPAHIHYYKQLTRQLLQPLLKSAGLVICRSGYSTIMDLVALGKKAVLIPTPGQTEQEYLGKYLFKKKLFYTVKQNEFDLNSALHEIDHFHFDMPKTLIPNSGFKPIIDRWLAAPGSPSDRSAL